MKKYFFLFILFNYIFYSSFSQNRTESFNSLDSKIILDGIDEEILVFTNKKDKNRDFEYRSCITLSIHEDSAKNLEYFISGYYTNEKPYRDWNLSSIHFGPDSGQLLGFHDLHIETFDSIPSEKTIIKLLDRWMFTIKEVDYITVEYGIDNELWLKHFGYIPELK